MLGNVNIKTITVIGFTFAFITGNPSSATAVVFTRTSIRPSRRHCLPFFNLLVVSEAVEDLARVPSWY